MTLEIKPHTHGNWKLIQHTTHDIEVTCKDDNGKRQYIQNTHSKVIFIGPRHEH